MTMTTILRVAIITKAEEATWDDSMIKTRQLLVTEIGAGCAGDGVRVISRIGTLQKPFCMLSMPTLQWNDEVNHIVSLN